MRDDNDGCGLFAVIFWTVVALLFAAAVVAAATYLAIVVGQDATRTD